MEPICKVVDARQTGRGGKIGALSRTKVMKFLSDGDIRSPATEDKLATESRKHIQLSSNDFNMSRAGGSSSSFWICRRQMLISLGLLSIVAMSSVIRCTATDCGRV